MAALSTQSSIQFSLSTFTNSLFLIISSATSIFWIANRALHRGLRLYLIRSCLCLNSVNDFVLWKDVWICHICPPEVVKSSFSEDWLDGFVVTLLLDEMLDVTCQRWYRGRICLFCQGCYIWLALTNKICIVNASRMWIVRLTVEHDLIVSVSFMKYLWVLFWQTSADILFLGECPVYIWQSWDFGCHMPQFSPVNNETTSDWITANHGKV